MNESANVLRYRLYREIVTVRASRDVSGGGKNSWVAIFARLFGHPPRDLRHVEELKTLYNISLSAYDQQYGSLPINVQGVKWKHV